MTLEQFRLANETEKLIAILEHGRLMAQSIENGSRIFLYKLESFYVSACYASSDDQLTDITCFLEVDKSIPHYRKQLILVNPAEREYNA